MDLSIQILNGGGRMKGGREGGFKSSFANKDFTSSQNNFKSQKVLEILFDIPI